MPKRTRRGVAGRRDDVVPPLVMVEFRRGSPVGPLGGERDIDPAQLGDWQAILAEFPSARMRPVFVGDELGVWNAAAELAWARGDKSFKPSVADSSDYGLGFEHLFRISADRHHTRIAKRIARWSAVRRAWVRRGAPSPEFALSAPGKWAEQRHLDVSTTSHLPTRHCGVAARAVWETGGAGVVAGADGAGVRVIVVDLGCFTNHADLTGLPWYARFAPSVDQQAQATGWPPLLMGQQHALPDALVADAVNHGTGMLSLVCGQAAAFGTTNAGCDFGCVGVAPGISKVGVASSWRKPAGEDPQELLDTTLSRIAAMLTSGPVGDRLLRPGDVVLIERQLMANSAGVARPAEVTGGTFVPVEADPAVRTQIDLLTAAGVVVVEPGGNAPVDLDTYTSLNSGSVVISAPPTSSESAILVSHAPHRHGGADSPRKPHERRTDAVLGSRVDCWGPGEDVVMARWNGVSVNSLPPDYGSGSGSSPAAAIVAGVVASMQGIRIAAGKPVLDAPGVRTLLRIPQHGTPWDVPAGDDVRYMPDLAKLAAGGLLHPLVVLTDLADLREQAKSRLVVHVNRSGEWAGEPPALVPFPAAAAPGSNLEIRTRVLNLGAEPCAQVFVRHYWAPAHSVATPDSWTLIGTAEPIVVRANGEALAGPAVWSGAGVPASGRYAIAAVVGMSPAQIPPLAEIAGWHGFVAMLRAGTAGVRFAAPIPQSGMGTAVAPSRRTLAFHLTGAPDMALSFELRIEARLPIGATVKFPQDLGSVDVFRKAQRRATGGSLRDLNPVCAPEVIVEYEGLKLAAGAKYAAALSVWIPPVADEHRIDLVQSWKGVEVGRMTWQFVPQAAPEPSA